jgi:hypothetical protein
MVFETSTNFYKMNSVCHYSLEENLEKVKACSYDIILLEKSHSRPNKISPWGIMQRYSFPFSFTCRFVTVHRKDRRVRGDESKIKPSRAIFFSTNLARTLSAFSACSAVKYDKAETNMISDLG